MGQYLSIGIATKICVYDFDNKEKVLKGIEKEFGLDIYDIINEDSNEIWLKIKEDLFVKEIIPLAKEVSNFFNKPSKGYVEEDLEVIKCIDNPNYDKIVDSAHGYGFDFLTGNKICNDISYILNSHSSRSPDYTKSYAFCDIISFLLDGKIFMECYYDAFYALRQFIVNNLKSPLAKSMVVTIIG